MCVYLCVCCVCVFVCVCVCVSLPLRLLIISDVMSRDMDPICLAGADLQIKAWVDHCACVVETGLATQHWSGKSEGCA